MSSGDRNFLHISSEQGPHLVVDTTANIISQVGSEQEIQNILKSQNSTYESIRTHQILPGLTDAHDHVMFDAYSDVMKDPNLAGMDGKTALEAIREECRKRKEVGYTGFVLFRKTEQGLGLSIQDLDAVSQGIPIGLFDRSNHGGIANTKALQHLEEVASHMQSKPTGVLNKDGVFNEGFSALLKFEAMASVADNKLLQSLEKVLLQRRQGGTVAVHDMGLQSARDIRIIVALKKKWEKERSEAFPITMAYVMYIGGVLPDPVGEIEAALREGVITESDKKWLGIKYFADGSFGSYSAHLCEDYIGKHGHKGERSTNPSEILKMLDGAAQVGINEVAAHAIGDAAINDAVEVGEAWQGRFRIEHFELPLPAKDILQRIKDADIWVCPQPNFFTTDYAYVDRLGNKRVEELMPHSLMHKYGVGMMFGTDRMPASMLLALACATGAQFGDQILDFSTALHYAAATPAQYEGAQRGVLEVGQSGDVFLCDDLFALKMQKGKDLLQHVIEGAPLEPEMTELVNELHESVRARS